MYQYCHYRYYLSYLHHNAVNNYGAFKGAQATASSNTQDALRYIGKTGERIEREIAHAREVYPQALVAYGEFERTYGSHVVLTFIHNDYIEIRNGLKKLMNPIGQVVYKAFYAQGKK